MNNLNIEVITILGSTLAIVFTTVFLIHNMRAELDSRIESIRTELDLKIERLVDAMNKKSEKMDEKWYELLGKFHTLDKEVQELKK